jgi:hypothetical protein
MGFNNLHHNLLAGSGMGSGWEAENARLAARCQPGPLGTGIGRFLGPKATAAKDHAFSYFGRRRGNTCRRRLLAIVLTLE